jgi:hypothetical protein
LWLFGQWQLPANYFGSLAAEALRQAGAIGQAGVGDGQFLGRSRLLGPMGDHDDMSCKTFPLVYKSISLYRQRLKSASLKHRRLPAQTDHIAVKVE